MPYKPAFPCPPVVRLFSQNKLRIWNEKYDYGKFVLNGDMKKVEIFKDKIIGFCYSNEYNLIVKELKSTKI